MNLSLVVELRCDGPGAPAPVGKGFCETKAQTTMSARTVRNDFGPDLLEPCGIITPPGWADAYGTIFYCPTCKTTPTAMFTLERAHR